MRIGAGRGGGPTACGVWSDVGWAPLTAARSRCAGDYSRFGRLVSPWPSRPPRRAAWEGMAGAGAAV